jgi:hypothetical protein
MFICVSTSNLNLYDKLVRTKTEGKGRESEEKKEKCIQVQVVHHTLYILYNYKNNQIERHVM